jgi:fatty-acid peroxygenase
MPKIPSERGVDGSVALLRDGYEFISNRCRRLGTDIFATRLLGRRTICLMGEEAAKLFYDQNKFHRAGATPKRVQRTLVGVGGVQGLDSPEHRDRKRMFMSLMSPERIQMLARLTAQAWSVALGRWQQQGRVVLLPEVEEILCRAVCQWSGVQLAETDVKRRTAEFHAMIDGGGALGLRHWRALRARRSAERWIADIIAKLRAGKLQAPEDTALHVIGLHRTDQAGKLLAPRIAAVEVINILRPTVAVGTFITFAAVALHQHPESRRFAASADARELEWFVQEVRRFYPFFPFIAARVSRKFEWRGYTFPKRRRVLLDLYGTDHDPRIWAAPDEFHPERFRDWNGSEFNFIPHGGGDHYEHHRCPGEWITIELMKVAVSFLATGMSYRVPEQDLSINLSRIPALPKSRFVMDNVRPTKPATAAPLELGGRASEANPA